MDQLLEEGRDGKPAAAHARLQLLRHAGSYVLQHCDTGAVVVRPGAFVRLLLELPSWMIELRVRFGNFHRKSDDEI